MSQRADAVSRAELRPPEPAETATLPGSAPAGDAIVDIRGLAKTYGSGVRALEPTDLAIRPGEIFALLGPNGAGKTTLISIVCGIVRASAGSVTIGGFDHVRDWRAARGLIGLVPQELSTDSFETVWGSARFSRGLFGKPPDDAYLETMLRQLSLWDKRASPILELSGGMKRRVLIAKALAHEPRILFLDEPTAGVDVELRRDMWALVRSLRAGGVTVILTTHYIEEAEEMADRVGMMRAGRLILVEDKTALMQTLGKRRLAVRLGDPLAALPAAVADLDLALDEGGRRLTLTLDAAAQGRDVTRLMRALSDADLQFTELETRQDSLEDIFISLTGGPR